MKKMEMNETVVISGFPGTGKTHYVNDGKGNGYMPELFAIDSDSSKFPKENFPDNYISHIKECIGKYKVVFVSSHKEVRDALVNHGIKFTLVYPHVSLKMEYVRRYMNRGSNEKFIDMIYKNWEKWIDELNHQEGCNHIVFSSGDFMSNRRIF